jgi:predicted DNA-binding transcriptional regulator AlpA
MKIDPFKGIELLGSKDVQNVLGVSRSFIQRIIDDKLIPAQKTSAGWIFPKNEVLTFQSKRIEKAKNDKRIHL